MNISKHLIVSTPFLKVVIFAQSEFYSNLKQDFASDEEYEKSKVSIFDTKNAQFIWSEWFV